MHEKGDARRRKNMIIHLDKLYKDDRTSQLLGLGLPFGKGELPENSFGCLCIKDKNEILPSQFKVTSRWEDGSVRFVYARFLADIPGNSKKDFELCSENNTNNTKNAEGISVDSSGEGIAVDNGILSFKVKNGSKELFDEFICNGHRWEKEQFVGPLVKVGDMETDLTFDEFKVIEEGPVFVLVEGKGSISKELKFTVRISVTYGKAYIELAFRLFNCADGDIRPDSWIFAVKARPDSDINLESPEVSEGRVDSTGCGDANKTTADDLVFVTTGTKELGAYDFADERALDMQVRTCVGRSNYKTEFKISSKAEAVSNSITAEQLTAEANEHFGEVMYGTFFGDVTLRDENAGVCATVYQAFQNFPKAVKADKDGVCVYLIPDQDKNAHKTKAEPVVFASGMAREQKVLLHFHGADEPLYEIDSRSLIYQMPDTPYVDPEEFAKAKVFPNVFLPYEQQVDDVEISLIDKADTHARCYGMLNFGDGPDPGYTAQGRGGGNLVWTNNEYDYPHAMFMMYARSGVRRFYDYARIAAMHWMDVDICHYSSDPLQIGGQWEHTRKHTGGSEEGAGNKGVMVCSHEWVEGLLDYYHFTGDERGYDTAIGIGENVLRLLETPMYQVPGESSARETGWALRTLTALYVETHDKKWIARCEWILQQFRSWKDRYGGWLSPYTDNTTIRVGFMISVALGSLMRYYRVFPDDGLKAMMLEAVDDLIENASTPQGLFYYKELPSLSRNGNNTLLLEACGIGYELTGDTSYLDAGVRTFKKAISNPQGSIGGKKIVEDSVIVGNGAPKNFAQSFYPITYFYTLAVNAKKLLI